MQVKRVLITGANRGLGLEMVKWILNKYNPVFIFATYRDPKNSEELFTLAGRTACVIPVQMDITSECSIEEAFVGVREKIGEEYGLNLLINNAGIFRPQSQSLETVRKGMVMEFFETNVLGHLFTTQRFLPLLEKASGLTPDLKMGVERAAVVNLSSLLGSIQDNKSGGMYASRCSRAAENAMTRSMGLDLLSKGILVVGMNPGWVRTDQGGSNAPLTPEQSISGIFNALETVDESSAGRVLQFDGKVVPW